MISSRRQDADLFAFDVPDALQPYLEAARALGKEDARRQLPEIALRVRALGVAELILELDNNAHALLFHIARELARIDPAAAWAGLQDAPSAWLGLGIGAVALPVKEAWGGAARYLVALPALHPGYGVIACSSGSDSSRCIWHPSQSMVHVAWSSGRPLQGLDGRLCVLDTTPTIEKQQLLRPAWEGFVNANTSLLCGLVAGGCERLADEALAYARQRQSAGKPIAQHQAVALRLADLTMHQRALSLQFAMHSAVGGWLHSAHVLGPAAEMACDIARDALQTAAAHGFVEGLPFMRLHQHIHALAALLTAWSRHLLPEEDSNDKYLSRA